MKKTKTEQLNEIAQEINQLFKELSENHPLKAVYEPCIWADNGRLNVKYKSYWSVDKLSLDIAIKWLELFKLEPQKHYNAKSLILAEKKLKEKEKQNDAKDYYVIKNHNMIPAKLISLTKKQIQVLLELESYPISYSIDRLNICIFDNKDKALETLKLDIKNEINRLKDEISKLESNLNQLN